MKRTIPVLFAIAAVLAGCKKTYTCECVTTDRYDDGSTVETVTYKSAGGEYSAKMSKKQAEAACNHEEEATESAYTNWWTDNGTVPLDGISTSTECTLK